jgi:hypothetical protein
MFRLQGKKIINEKGKAIDVAGSNDREDANIIVHNVNNQRSQEWNIVYVDEDKKEPGEGELNEEYGFYVGRAFYAQTSMDCARWLDVRGGKNLVISDPKYG